MVMSNCYPHCRLALRFNLSRYGTSANRIKNMFETWLATMRQGVIGRNIRLLRQMWAVSPGVWITGGGIFFIGIQAIRVHINHADQDHRQKIAAAFGAANTFYGVPQMNHDGSRFTYVATTET